MKRIITFSLFFLLLLSLNGCAFLRLLISPRGAVGKSIARASTIGARGIVASSATVATIGRVTSFSLIRGIGKNFRLPLYSNQNKLLAEIVKKGNRTEIIGKSLKIPYMQSNKVGKTITHYSNGNIIGHSEIRKNIVRHFGKNNKELGYDKIIKNRIEHYDRHHNKIFTSKIITRNGEKIYKVIGTTQRLNRLNKILEYYARDIVFQDLRVQNQYFKLLSATDNCLNGFGFDNSACNKMRIKTKKLNHYMSKKYK